jgi:hypothetical protein
MQNIIITNCVLHEGAGQLEVKFRINEIELNTTYFLFHDDDDWVYSDAYDGNGNKRDEIISIQELVEILEQHPILQPYKHKQEAYNKRIKKYY